METLKAKRKLTSAFPSSTARSPASASRKVNSIINFIKSAEQSHSNAPTATYSQSIGSSSSKKSSAPVIVLDSDEEPECRETTNTYNSSNQASTGFIHQEVISLLDEEDDDDEKVQLPPSNTVLSNPTIEVDDVQIAKVEEVAIIPRSVTFPSKPVLDSNMDVEADDGLDQQLGSSHALCLVCDSDLSQLTEDLKELHLQQCLDTVLPPSHDGDHVESDRLDQAEAKENDTTSTANVDDAQRGLRNKFFFCVLCDMELSGRRLLYRCLHLKKCAREKGMSTKQLLQHISPVGEYGEEENEDELDDELEEELAEDAEGHHDRAESKEVASTSSGKNAFSFLMASAKEQASMKGMFEYREKTIKAPVATATVATTTTATKGRKSNATTKKAALSSDGTTSTNNRWMYAKKKPNGNQSNPGYAPAYKKIQIGNMTYPIVVDGFQYSSSLLSDTYFLTHFHSDHYIGLSKDFNCGHIYCSPTTASLVKQKLHVSACHIIALELERKYTITVGGVEVDVVCCDANHCPGAMCVSFALKDTFGTSKSYIFHTGDFRWTKSLLRSSAFYRSLSNLCDSLNPRHLTVYLDTTYCDANYDFPHQDAAINGVIDCIREENKKTGALYVFGAYSIGKERVFMAAAAELKMKVFVDKTRWKTMLCYDWTMEQQTQLTTDPFSTSLWVVPLHNINFNSLVGLLKKKSSCNRVVAFQPTGWTHNNSPGSDQGHKNRYGSTNNTKEFSPSDIVGARRKEGHVIYSVPYSEHSSFTELVDFIQTFKPYRVVPTVNVSPEKVQQQLQLLKDKSGIYQNQTSTTVTTSTTEISKTTSTASVSDKPSGSRSVNMTMLNRTTSAPTTSTADKKKLPLAAEYIDDQDDFKSEFF